MLKVIRREGLSREEYALASFLQGGVNKRLPEKIIIDVDIYLDYTDEPYEYAELWTLVDRYIDSFDGIAVYDLAAGDVGINMAATVCGVNNYLGVPRGLIDRFKDKKILFDSADYKGSSAERQERVFELCRDRLDPSGLVHQVVLGEEFRLELRDFAILKGYFCFFTDQTEEDIAFRHRVLQWADRNIAIYGWTTDEISFLKDISAYGCYVVPMDWSANHSYFSNDVVEDNKRILSGGGVLKQRVGRGEKLPQGKHYLAIVVSDGDNVQWLERDFATTSTFGQRLRSPMDYKINWTISPSMTELCPLVMQGLYNKGKKDYFLSGVSGIGYTNLLTYPGEHLEDYLSLTARAMGVADLREICMLDNIDMLSDIDEVHRRLDMIASHTGIDGGIWELDPNRYESGAGRVLFSSDGKPFLSVRLSLWHPSNCADNITEKWLDGYADAINAMPVSPNTVDGYTVLNVHPWTVSISHLDYLVSRLKEHIEIVYVDQLLAAVRDNIPHVDAAPNPVYTNNNVKSG